MDNEVLELLKSMQSDMKSMQSDMKSMQGDMKSMKSGMTTMQSDIKTMQDDMKSMKNDMKVMNTKIDKNTLMIEDLTVKTQIVTEVLKSHISENERQHNEIIIPIKEKIDVMELAITDTSKDMKELNEKFDKVEKVTMQNTYDVAYLKMAK